MKILMLSPAPPVPANNGSRIRILNFIKGLSAEGNEITLLCLAGASPRETAMAQEALGHLCRRVIIGPPPNRKEVALAKWLFSSLPYRHVKMYRKHFVGLVRREIESGDHDVIFCNFLDMAQYIEGVRSSLDSSLCVIDQHNWDESWFASFRDRGAWPLRLFGEINIKRLRKVQGRYYSLFDLCLSVSEEDRQATQAALRGQPRVMLARNGVDLEYFRPNEKGRRENTILFCGSMDVKMNQDAVLYFHRRIFPLVRSRCPDCRFLVVGRNPPPAIKGLSASPGVVVTGTVEDVRPYYEQASVLVAPFQFGGGTKLKIAEAMAMRVPVVSTTVGCQGMEVEHGAHLLVADDARDFADHVLQVLGHFPEAIVENAHRLVCEHYAWRTIVSGVSETMREMLHRKRAA